MLEALKENIFDAEEEAASLKTDMTSVREAIFGTMAGDEEALLDVLTVLREQPAIGTINFRLWSGWASLHPAEEHLRGIYHGIATMGFMQI